MPPIKSFLQWIKVLQKEIDKFCKKGPNPLQASATVEWNTKSLILSFKEKTFNIKTLVPQHPKL